MVLAGGLFAALFLGHFIVGGLAHDAAGHGDDHGESCFVCDLAETPTGVPPVAIDFEALRAAEVRSPELSAPRPAEAVIPVRPGRGPPARRA